MQTPLLQNSLLAGEYVRKDMNVNLTFLRITFLFYDFRLGLQGQAVLEI